MYFQQLVFGVLYALVGLDYVNACMERIKALRVTRKRLNNKNKWGEKEGGKGWWEREDFGFVAIGNVGS